MRNRHSLITFSEAILTTDLIEQDIESTLGWLIVEDFGWQVEFWSSLISGFVIMFLVFLMTAWSEEL